MASYAYTDAKITQSNDGQQGNQLFNVPFNAASLWTTYELQTGNWKGLVPQGGSQKSKVSHVLILGFLAVMKW
ncbi:MAG: TonB-dependent receptor [Nostoc sp.]|uniref:TonB-dependent receptor domain-containing protein n=1 Tax=Nostoc sp. TaxID=1180 RepID=UPI002FFB4F21